MTSRETTEKMTREEWLERLTEELRPMFAEAGAELPERVRVACGFPSKMGLARRNRRIGECWDATAAGDKIAQVYISPTIDDSIRAADILTHELVHAAVGCRCGHKGAFRRVAKAIGLEGKMTATHAGEELTARLQAAIESAGLPAYPHVALNGSNRPKVQSTRMLKLVCDGCGMVVRTARKWLDEVGAPACACGGDFDES